MPRKPTYNTPMIQTSFRIPTEYATAFENIADAMNKDPTYSVFGIADKSTAHRLCLEFGIAQAMKKYKIA